MANIKLEKIVSPFNIGKVTMKNRMIRSGAGTHTADDGHHVSDKGLFYYGAIARGGVGMITVEGNCINYNRGEMRPHEMDFNNDKYIPRAQILTQLIHSYGCKAFLQILHIGAGHPLPGTKTIAASALTAEEMPPQERPFHPADPPRAMEIAEIEMMEGMFADYAERAKKAGFDGVEINGGHSHLINSFISRIWNKRQDQYGCQSLENRARFMVEIIQAVKKRCGQDFPVIVIINGSELGHPLGTTIEEAQEFARIFQTAGADALHVRAFGYGDGTVKQWVEQMFYPEPPNPLPKGLDWSRKGAGASIPLATAIKKVVSIPVITTGRLDPVMAEQFIREGKVDFIEMQRRLLADTDLPNKAISGHMDDVAPCTACLQCCSDVALNKDLHCRVNAALGGDEDYRIPKAEKLKKVVVIGGGPGGMEAARVAALRGHRVTLYEKEPKLGGLLPLAALVKGTEIEDLPALVKYLETQIIKLGVDIKLGKEFTSSLLNEIKPDAVIVAAGASATVPDIPGIDNKIVVSGASLHHKLKTLLRHSSPESLRPLTRLWMPVGKKVVIIGGAIQGVELAEFLIKRGRKVTIVDSGPQEALGEGMAMAMWGSLMVWLGDKGIPMLTEVKYEEITDKGLVITTKDGKRQLIEADSIATATSMKPNNELLQELKGKVGELYAIGDCHKPGLIIDAIAEGYHTARAV